MSECDCYPGGFTADTYEGPQEHCPVHGKPTPNDTRCPVCGEVGVKACVDDTGRELNYDHDGRPPFFPPRFKRVFPRANG